MIGLRALLTWFAVLVLAILNGGLREEVLIPVFGPAPAQFLSGLLLCGLILVVTRMAIGWIGADSLRQHWAVGAAWMAMTLAFETGFGLLVQHRPPAELLHMYSFSDGNIWPLVPLTLLVAPRLVARGKAAPA